jgi:hypothetical protein
MPKYGVYIYYHGCFGVEVNARNEEEALEKARKKAEKMDPKEFLENVSPLEDGHDVSEIEETKAA